MYVRANMIIPVISYVLLHFLISSLFCSPPCEILFDKDGH